MFRKRCSDDVKWIGIMQYYVYQLSYRQVGRQLFRDHGTVKGWWQNFTKYGMPTKQRCKPPKALGTLELNYLRNLVAASPTIYLDELAEKLRDVYNVSVSLSTICRALYHDLKLTRKKITKYNREKSQALQRDYWTILNAMQAQQFQLVFIDETAKDSRDIARLYGRY